LISQQEHEAWDVLLACQGQLRLAPSGRVIGIDLDAALKIGAARCYNLAVVSELLPAAEAGLVEALRVDADRPIEALIAPTNVRSSSHCGPLRYAAHPSESDLAPELPSVDEVRNRVGADGGYRHRDGAGSRLATAASLRRCPPIQLVAPTTRDAEGLIENVDPTKTLYVP
jgi:hypothetical protein